MPSQLKIENVHGAGKGGKLNEEWIEVVNEGDKAFNGEGISITTARSSSGRPRVVTTLKAGLVIQPAERVRLVTGSSGKKSHGDPPDEAEARNFHLFLKAHYLDRPGLIVRLVNRQLELCRATFGADGHHD